MTKNSLFIHLLYVDWSMFIWKAKWYSNRLNIFLSYTVIIFSSFIFKVSKCKKNFISLRIIFKSILISLNLAFNCPSVLSETNSYLRHVSQFFDMTFYRKCNRSNSFSFYHKSFMLQFLLYGHMASSLTVTYKEKWYNWKALHSCQAPSVSFNCVQGNYFPFFSPRFKFNNKT